MALSVVHAGCVVQVRWVAMGCKVGCRASRGSGGGSSAVAGVSPAARHEEDLPLAQHRLARPDGGRRAAQLGRL